MGGKGLLSGESVGIVGLRGVHEQKGLEGAGGGGRTGM